MFAERGRMLLRLARHAIERALGVDEALHMEAAWLAEPGATFVTLKQNGRLRGCIGSLEACRPLIQDVAVNAVAAALRDPRYPPLTAEELPDTEVEVSLLSPMEPVLFRSEEDAIGQLCPGVDGVVLECGSRRGTFLPQVWDDLPDPRQFLRQLKRKAGLAEDFWSPEIRLHRYTVAKWKESELKEAAA
ncbi:MAG TPA: AmmeMemoRadiSam system protein A [Burkholderiales bacterium]|nr:AmmeMemoRadiSam system protein A [Burkholderiales bacterium]